MGDLAVPREWLQPLSLSICSVYQARPPGFPEKAPRAVWPLSGPSFSRRVLNQPGSSWQRVVPGPFLRGAHCDSEQDARGRTAAAHGERRPLRPKLALGRTPTLRPDCLVLGEGAAGGVWAVAEAPPGNPPEPPRPQL